MKRYTAYILCVTLVLLVQSTTVQAAVQLYTGRMHILTTSGKNCQGLAGTHDASLVLSEEAVGSALSGYFVSEAITIGRFSGSDPARLDVRYSFYDDLRATGHVLSLIRSNDSLVVELRDRHIEDTVDDCNFDLARMELTRSPDGDAAGQLAQISGVFDAQLTRSQAVALAQSGNYKAALPYFAKGLELADTFLPRGSEQIDPYIIGLATGYIWLERFEEFNTLFDARIMTLSDEAIRSAFSVYRVASLMKAGRSALGREEYETAQKNFEQASKLQPRNREVIAAVMSVHVRRGQYAEAISFLERIEPLLLTEADRKDIRGATAVVLYKKALQDDRDGHGIDAENGLKRAMELDPAAMQYRIALARQRHKAGNLADAELLLEQGLEQFKDQSSQNQLHAAREKLLQTELFLKKIRKAGS